MKEAGAEVLLNVADVGAVTVADTVDVEGICYAVVVVEG